MTTTAKSSPLLRSLPLLLALLIAFLVTPAAPAQPAAHLGSSVTHTTTAQHDAVAATSAPVTRTPAAVDLAQATTQPVPDARRAPHAQRSAEVAASRAPPAAI